MSSEVDAGKKQQLILQGDDTTVSHAIYGTEVDVIPSVASSVSLANGRGATSSRVTSKPISKRAWDLRNPTGHIIAVSSQGRFLAYVIRGTGNQEDGEAGDRIRVCNRRTASKGLLSGLMGSTLDLAFSYEKDQKPLLAAVDDLGCVLVVRVEENEEQTVLTFQPVVTVFPPADQPTNTWRRVVWSPYVRCIDTDSVPDLAQSLIVTNDNRAELWRLDIIGNIGGGRSSSNDPLMLENVSAGRYDVTEHQMPITDAVLSCDGEHLIVGTTSLDGYVNFLQLDAIDETPGGDGGYNVSVLQHWRPHNGLPVYSLCFLDNVEEPLSTMWKYALTLSQSPNDVNAGYAEIKLWHCQTWDCLQTLSFQPSIQAPPSLRLQLSMSGDFAFLTDVNRAVLYLIHLDISESSAKCGTLTELLLASECLDFALLKVGFKSPKGYENSNSFTNGGNDDQENTSLFLLNGSLVAGNPGDNGSSLQAIGKSSGGSPVSGHLIAVSPKLIHELTIKLAGLPTKMETASPSQKRIDSEIGRHLVTPDVLNRSLNSAAKNSPGGASTLTGVTSLPLTALNNSAPEQDDSRPTTGVPISLFPGGINIHSPHGTQQSKGRLSGMANSTNSVNFSPQQQSSAPQMVIHAASMDGTATSQRDVVGMLFEAADRFRTNKQGSNMEPNRLHRPSPPPSDTSLEVADILNPRITEDTNKHNGNDERYEEPSSVTPQLLAPGALLGQQNTPGTENAQISNTNKQNRQVEPVTNPIDLNEFKQSIGSLAESQRSIMNMLNSLSDRLNTLELRAATAKMDPDSVDANTMAMQLGNIIGRQTTERVEKMLTEAIADCRNQVDANGRQAVADVKTAVSQQVADRVHASMDVFRHALQGVITSRPVIDSIASSTSEAVSHSVANTSREVFQSSVLPAVDRSVQNMLSQLGDTLAQGTAQYEQRLRSSMDNVIAAHQQAIKQQYSTIETALIGHVEEAIDRKFREQMVNYEQKINDSQKNFQSSLLRSVTEKMDNLARQTASTVDQAVAGAVARSRPVTPAPTPTLPQASAADIKKQISEHIRRNEFNSAFQTALGATDLAILVWLCQQVPTSSIFKGAGSCPLSQAVLLSFIQQMTVDLTSHSELKADWLSEAIMALEPTDPLVARNLPVIAKGAENGIDRYTAAVANAPPGTTGAGSTRVAKSLRMAQSILRSLLLSSNK